MGLIPCYSKRDRRTYPEYWWIEGVSNKALGISAGHCIASHAMLCAMPIAMPVAVNYRHHHRHFTWYDGLNRLPQPQLPVPPLIGSAFDLRPLCILCGELAQCVRAPYPNLPAPALQPSSLRAQWPTSPPTPAPIPTRRPDCLRLVRHI